jgi:hypothetical protein
MTLLRVSDKTGKVEYLVSDDPIRWSTDQSQACCITREQADRVLEAEDAHWIPDQRKPS